MRALNLPPNTNTKNESSLERHFAKGKVDNTFSLHYGLKMEKNSAISNERMKVCGTSNARQFFITLWCCKVASKSGRKKKFCLVIHHTNYIRIIFWGKQYIFYQLQYFRILAQYVLCGETHLSTIGCTKKQFWKSKQTVVEWSKFVLKTLAGLFE